MRQLRQDRKTNLILAAAALVAIVVLLLIPPALSVAPPLAAAKGWELENSEPPTYAVIDPVRSNVNVDSVVLVCGELHGRLGLQLELYLSSAGPLLPRGATADELNKVPRAEIAIDGWTFVADLMFADDFVVVVDQFAGDSTMVSNLLLDAMERGRTMTMRFDLLAGTGDDEGFDGELVLDLQAGAGGAAVAAVRRCAADTELWSRR